MNQQYTPDTDRLRQEIVTNTSQHQFLSAGAGAGKTTVLVDHYYHLLAAGCRPAELIAVTFTEKAAAEMKGRLRDKCRRQAQRLRRQQAAEAAHWESLLPELEVAPISTIHGLCARLLRENSLVAGLDPDFSVCDEIDSQLLLEEVVSQTLLSRLGSATSADALVVGMGYERAVTSLIELIEDRVKVAGVLADPAYSSPQTLLAGWQQTALQQQREVLAGLLQNEELAAALTYLKTTSGPAGDKLELRRQEICTILEDYDLANVRPDDLSPERCEQLFAGLRKLQAIRAGNLGSGKDWEALGLDKDEMLAAQKQLIHSEGVVGQLQEQLEQTQSDSSLDPACAELTWALVAEVQAALAAYQQAKEERSWLDFEDLMERTHDLWQTQPAALRRTSQALRQVMIDEFQDTNTLQKQVLWPLVTGQVYDPANPQPLPPDGPRLFVVGDAKQSIYRFRNADVTVVNTTRREMQPPLARDDELTRNFRSTGALIAAYNRLFASAEVMGLSPSETYQAGYAPMQAVRSDPPPGQAPLEVHLLTAEKPQAKSEGAEEEEDASLTRLRELEAAWLAQWLVRLLTSGEKRVQHDRGEDAPWEPVKPGDIALLFRSLGDVRLYERALRQAGLPYYLVVGRGYFSAQEVRDVVQALRAVENGLDDIALVGALRSPLFGLSDETLYWLGQRGPGPWWWRLQQAVQEPLFPAPTPEQRQQTERLQWAAALLEDLRQQKNRLPLPGLVQTLLDRTGLTATLAAQFNGHQMISNVRKLVELAGQFETERQPDGQGSLRDFIEHLKLMITQEVREGQAPVEEEAGDSIKLITYHSAKGLQWPVVVVPDLCRKPGGGGMPTPYRFHPEQGLVVNTTYLIRPPKGSGNYWPPLGRAIAARNQAEDEAEDRRLFYVAATRAQDLLLLSGVTYLNKDGGHSRSLQKVPLGWLNAAWSQCLWDEAPQEPADRLWRWDGTTLAPSAEPADLGATYALAKAPEANPQPAELTALPARLADLPPVLDGQQRFTATELSLYNHCPRLYELERRLGLPGGQPALGAEVTTTALSGLEFGTLVHRVLQLVGTGGQEALDRLVPPDAREVRLDPQLDKRAAAEASRLRQLVQRFLDSPLYGRLFTADSRLRSEAGLAVLLPVGATAVLIEGKIDALVETADGQLHLLDYKTGREDPAKSDQYRVQIGLYCHAVEQARGQLPASASLVYLTDNQPQVVELDVAATTREALAAAAQAITGIWQGSFPQRLGECGYCVGWQLCRPAGQTAQDEVEQDE
jgi:ATP-dependent helicase/nuclease subunit A